MKCDPRLRSTGRSPQHHRRSIRLKGYDYTQAGAYFVTICTQNRECLFGEVVDSIMQVNECGAIVREEWFCSAEIRQEIELVPDAFVVMPNHIHGIVWIVESDNAVGACGVVGATGRSPLQGRSSLPQPSPPRGPGKRSLASFIAGFKSATTKRINAHRATPGTPVWQRNYYEHIIRDDESMNRIRQYIVDNPIRWQMDRENPNAVEPEPEEAWRA